MPGTLYVVATPIGNLEDVTLRALRILREVSVIAAEDTRRTSRLLQHYSISTPTTSLHAHNEDGENAAAHRAAARQANPLRSCRMRERRWSRIPARGWSPRPMPAGIRVEPVPGAKCGAGGNLRRRASAATGSCSSGSRQLERSARREWLGSLAAETRPFVLYEAPHRIRATLEDMLAVLGDRTVALGRELTKAHEELVVRPISEHLADIG